MKTGKMMKCLMAVLMLCIGASPVLAQKNIDKLVKELEKRTDVSINSVTKRDPKTRKVISQVKTYSVKDEKMSFVKAFEQDEEDAITAIKDLPKGRANIKDAKLTFMFSPKEDEMRTYTLEVNRMGVVTLTVIIKQVKNARDVSVWEVDNMRLNKFRQNWNMADELGCAVNSNGEVNKLLRKLDITLKKGKGTLRENGVLVLEGDAWRQGKKLQKRLHSIRGHRVIVR